MQGDVIEHSYLYPGVYIVAFQEHTESGEGVALQQEVTVLFPQVTVKRIDEAFVRLHNHHSFVLDASTWQLVSGGSFFVFPENSLVPSQSGVTIPFAVDLQDRLFFVTAGGGQFSGENKLFGGVQNDSGADVVTAQNVPAEKNTENDIGQSVDTLRDDRHEEDDFRDSDVNAASGIRMIIIWALLLFGVIVVAIVPFVFSRSESRKRDGI